MNLFNKKIKEVLSEELSAKCKNYPKSFHEEAIKNLYAEKFSSVLNHSKFVLKIKITDKNVAYIYNTLKEVEESQ